MNDTIRDSFEESFLPIKCEEDGCNTNIYITNDEYYDGDDKICDCGMALCLSCFIDHYECYSDKETIARIRAEEYSSLI